MTNWCESCNGSGFTGWLWWAKTCAACDGKKYAKPPQGHGYIPMGLPSPAFIRNVNEALRIGREAKARNDASQTVKPGSAVDVGLQPKHSDERSHGVSPCGNGSSRSKGIASSYLIIAATLALASLTGCSEPVAAQPEVQRAPRVYCTTIATHGAVYVSEVEIDGECYIVANMNKTDSCAVAICPKVKPEVQP